MTLILASNDTKQPFYGVIRQKTSLFHKNAHQIFVYYYQLISSCSSDTMGLTSRKTWHDGAGEADKRWVRKTDQRSIWRITMMSLRIFSMCFCSKRSGFVKRNSGHWIQRAYTKRRMALWDCSGGTF